jgi:hypothetical protein
MAAARIISITNLPQSQYDSRFQLVSEHLKSRGQLINVFFGAYTLQSLAEAVPSPKPTLNFNSIQLLE